MGSKNGFSLFSLSSIDSSLEHIYTSLGEEINIVERLFSSSLVAVVSLNAPRKLKVRKKSIVKTAIEFKFRLFKRITTIFRRIRFVTSKKERKYAITRMQIQFSV